MKNSIIVLLILLLFAVGGYAFYANQQMQQEKAQKDQITKEKQALDIRHQQEIADMKKKEEEMMQQKIPVTLSEENKSGESGTATLVEKNGKVVVTVSLTGFTQDVSQPAHIHVGACPGVGTIKYPLKNVVNGSSETTIDATMDDLKKGLPLALNVHKSADQMRVYTACGDITFNTSASIPVSPSPSATTTSSSPSAAPSSTPTKY